MKTIIKITVFLVLSIMCLKSSAQSCFVGTITLNSQSDINNFQANYGPCDSIVPGSKLIIDDLAGDIVDSSPLSDLTFVNWLQVYNTDLTNIDGFENLSQSTMSKCIFVDNPLLEDISALSGIVNGSDWSFTNSPALTDLTGIDQITGYGTSLTLSNLGITDLDDLSNLTLIARFFTLSNNANLTDISGLSNLTDFGAGQNGGFFIKDNPNLADCSAICSLVKNLLPTRPTNTVDIQGNIAQCIDEATVISSCATTPCNYGFTNLGLGSQAAVNNFQITYGPCDSLSAILVIADSNNNITDLSTLSTLRYSNGIIVDGNNNLTDLSGLENLEVLNLGTFRISDNPILTDISQLSNVGPFSGRIEFRNNPSLTDLSTAQNFTGASRLIVDDMDGLTDLDDFSNIDRRADCVL